MQSNIKKSLTESKDYSDSIMGYLKDTLSNLNIEFNEKKDELIIDDTEVDSDEIFNIINKDYNVPSIIIHTLLESTIIDNKVFFRQKLK